MTIHFGADSTSLASGDVGGGPTASAVWDNRGTYSNKRLVGVSSISDQSTGESRINFSSNMADVNYVCAGMHDSTYYGNGADSRLPGFDIEDKNVGRVDLHFWVMHSQTNARHHGEYDDCTAAFWR
tara:strand:+ start:576 stop:953 length:378 start_codon:yes stop_codon:yes gene_type:complete